MVVKNELIKIFTRGSTRALIILLAAAAFTLVGARKLSDFIKTHTETEIYESYSADYPEYYEEGDLAGFYEGAMDELRQDYEDGLYSDEAYDTAAALIKFCEEHEISVSWYEWGVEEEDGSSCWQGDAVTRGGILRDFYYEMKYGTDESMRENYSVWYEAVCTAVAENDWKLYYQTMADYYDVIDPDETDATHIIVDYHLSRDEDPNDPEPTMYAIVRDYATAKERFAGYEKKIAEGTYISDTIYNEALEEMLVGKYRLEHQAEDAIYYDYHLDATGEGRKAELVTDGDYFYSMNLSVYLVYLVSAILIILAGGSIAKEYSLGTIRSCLISPVSRRKFYWSKYLGILLVSLFFTIGAFVVSAIAATLFYGISGMNAPYLYVTDGELHVVSAWLYILKAYALEYIGILPYMTFAFMLSALTRNSAVAVAAGILLQFGGSAAASFLSEHGMDFGRYFLFANTDLGSILQGNSVFLHHTAGFALCVIAVHMAVFLLAGLDGVAQRDV